MPRLQTAACWFQLLLCGQPGNPGNVVRWLAEVELDEDHEFVPMEQDA